MKLEGVEFVTPIKKNRYLSKSQKFSYKLLQIGIFTRESPIKFPLSEKMRAFEA